MPVIINYKVCNMGKGCPCIAACPTKSWFWDDEKKRPSVDNSKCNNCGICTKTCPARIISGALDEAGLKKIQEEIDNDPRSQEFLNEERFNLDPVNEDIVLNSSNFEDFINSNDVAIVDFWTPKFSARCKLSTITYNELLPEGKKVSIKKIDVLENEKLCKKIGITTIPALVVFHRGKIIDHIAAKIGLAEKEMLKERLKKALEKTEL